MLAEPRWDAASVALGAAIGAAVAGCCAARWSAAATAARAPPPPLPVSDGSDAELPRTASWRDKSLQCGLPVSVIVGSKNRCKLEAVRAVLRGKYPGIAATVTGVSVPTGVSEQPIGLDVTSQGSRNRAEAAFDRERAQNVTVLSIGIESGLFEERGVLYDVCICSIYDGDRHYVGYSSGFALPDSVANFITEPPHHDLGEACNLAGLTSNADIGQAEGCIGILSRGRIGRQAQTEQAVLIALLACDPQWFPESSLPDRAFSVKAAQ